MTGRERVFALLGGSAPDHLPLMPITMMFAADTLGVPYRDYAADHRVLAQAQVKTAEAFDLDYVSVISDPAREASDLGGEIEWFDDQPPAISEGRAVLSDTAALAGLRIPDPAKGRRMSDRVGGVALLRKLAGETRIVEGWVEGPCAMAADLRGVNTLMLDFFDDPGFVRELFEFVIEMELRFARAQVEAGADLIGVGDAAASLIGPKLYDQFVWPFERKLVEGLHDMGTRVRLHICGNTRKLFQGMGELGADIVDLDWMAPLDEARRQMPPSQVLLGNMDPVRALRDGTPETVVAALAECHRQAGDRYIAGAGCEVPRGTPPDNLRAMACYARTHRSG